MITIEQTKCNNCGLCIDICHEYCISVKEELLKIDHKLCSTCCQCIAVCPQEALSWNNFKPEKFDRKLLPDPDQLNELFRERRTIRNFKQKKIDKKLLEEIVKNTIYAPAHSFERRILLVDDDKQIREIDGIIYAYSMKIYRYLYKPRFMQGIVSTFTPDRETEYLKARPKLEAAYNRKRNFKSVPPAIIFIVADKRVSLHLESAQYALYNIDLYAQTKGLGCRNLVGNQMFLNKSKKIRNLLGLKKNEKIFGTMAIGYPAIKFRNKVNGKVDEIQWNN